MLNILLDPNDLTFFYLSYSLLNLHTKEEYLDFAPSVARNVDFHQPTLEPYLISMTAIFSLKHGQRDLSGDSEMSVLSVT